MEETTGFIDKLAEDVAGFDVVKFLPKLDSVMGWIGFLIRLAVLVGPVLILVLGLMYYFSPPKEANHRFGYRFYWGMGSVEAWRFTQRLAGAVWSVLGSLLTAVMLIVTLSFGAEVDIAMANAAFACIMWELVLIVGACIAINVMVAMKYDAKGNERPDSKIRFTEEDLKITLKKK